MWGYIAKRVVHAFAIVIAVNAITFCLFFMVNSPDDMARFQLGDKVKSQHVIDSWKVAHGYDKPLFYNAKVSGFSAWTSTLFIQSQIHLFTGQFGRSLTGRDIVADVKQRMWPSLAIALPTLVCSLIIVLPLGLLMAACSPSRLDRYVCLVSVLMMSISGLFYIIAGQYIVAKSWQWAPISGYQDGLQAWRFIWLAVCIAVISGLGSGLRWYRAIFLEQKYQDYVLTARAKGLSEAQIWLHHVLGNAALPIVTQIVAGLPLLFMGSLIMESFFAIPGLGSYTIDAIGQQDFEIIRVMVFIGTVLYLLGLLLTDIVYTWVDPRIRLSGTESIG